MAIPDDASEKRYRALLDTAPDAIVVVGEDERISFVNLQAERLFGYLRLELVGKTLQLLIPDKFRAGHKGHVNRFFKSSAVRPMGSGLELFGRHKTGREIPIEVSLSPLRTEDGRSVSAAIRDISQRKHMEAMATLTADRLASAVEIIQDAFALFDADDQLVLCNSVYRRLLSESLPGPLVGKSYEVLLDAWLGDLAFTGDEERARFRAERLAGRRDPEGAFDVRTKDGRSLRVMDRRTAEGGVVKTIWDLTEDVELAAELRVARAAAEAASAAKSDFLSSMSHELRTPLNAILGFAQLLERDTNPPLSQANKERVAQILKGGEHLLRLVEDILNLSRIEAGGVSMSTERVKVDEVLDAVRKTLEGTAARAGVSLEVASSQPEIAPIAADRTRFTQILINFGSNAIKYNRAGGGLVFSVSMSGNKHIRVTVTDTGMGIPLEQQEKLFRPFQRAGQETGPIEGTGIGLVIAKRLAELMHGSVGFHSEPGKGSEFWVELPVHTAAALPAKATAPKAAPANLRDDGRRLVLYVEDNAANVAFMRDLLGTFEGIELLTVPTGEAGVELARLRLPHVIIMDINLPGMSGMDALRELRTQTSTKRIPIIALTAAASEQERQRGLQAGFYRYLTKPVKVELLVSALKPLLAASRPGA